MLPTGSQSATLGPLAATLCLLSKPSSVLARRPQAAPAPAAGPVGGAAAARQAVQAAARPAACPGQDAAVGRAADGWLRGRPAGAAAAA